MGRFLMCSPARPISLHRHYFLPSPLRILLNEMRTTNKQQNKSTIKQTNQQTLSHNRQDASRLTRKRKAMSTAVAERKKRKLQKLAVQREAGLVIEGILAPKIGLECVPK